MKEVFVKGGDCTVSNVVFKGLGWDEGTGSWTSSTSRSLAHFSNGAALGIGEGIVMTTGNAFETEGPNSGDPIVVGNVMYGGIMDSDDDLGALVYPAPVKTVSILEFDFVPYTDVISFDYIFASQEYPEFSCSEFNDVFGFFISGSGITGNKNIALLPGTNTPVSIANIHPNHTDCFSAQNEQYYVDGFKNTYTAFDGHTTMLTTAEITVIPGEAYHLKLAIANVTDSDYGSGVFLRAGSLDLGLDNIVNHGNLISGMDNIFEGCEENKFTINLPPINENLNLTLKYSGAAVNDVVSPDGTPLPTSIVVPPNTPEFDVFYKIKSPVTVNGGDFNVNSNFQFCLSNTGISKTFYVYEKVKNPEFDIQASCAANGEIVSVSSFTGGSSATKLSIDDENIWYNAQSFSTVLPVGNHKIIFKDSVSCNIDTFDITVPVFEKATGDTVSVTIDQGQTYSFGSKQLSLEGTYNDTILTAAGCDSVVVLHLQVIKEILPEIIPDGFFTPNGDGISEVWSIKNIEHYDVTTVDIYDRFGKLLIRYNGSFKSWDGTYLGKPMPSTDYWYVITLKDIEKQYMGHFTLLRR